MTICFLGIITIGMVIGAVTRWPPTAVRQSGSQAVSQSLNTENWLFFALKNYAESGVMAFFRLEIGENAGIILLFSYDDDDSP